jgi:hypothetical protein
MKKLGLVVAVLMVVAAPALAAVNITCTADGNIVTVSYEVSGEPNKVRAFALDITVQNPANINTIDYNDPNYWVYPGSIEIVNGEVNDVGSPVASPTFPGTLGGLDTNGITIEMGSLYYPTGDNSPNAPKTGIRKLLKFSVCHVFSGCKVYIKENTVRGGVVLTNPTIDPTVTVASPAYTFVLVQIPPVPCPITYPTSDSDGSYTVSWTTSAGATSYQAERSANAGGSWSPVYDGANISYPESGLGNGSYRYRAKATNAGGSSDWCTGTWDCVVCILPAAPATCTVPVGPDPDGKYAVSWTASTGATSYQLESSAPASGTTIYPLWVQVYSGTAITYNEVVGGGTWSYRVKATNVCGSSAYTLGSNTITVTTNCLIGGNAGVNEFNDWVKWRYPACWCNQRQCRGDADGKKIGFWVALGDLTILRSAISKSTSQLILVPNGICADFDHKTVGFKVALSDLTILRAYISKPDASVPICNLAPVITGPYNWWAN